MKRIMLRASPLLIILGLLVFASFGTPTGALESTGAEYVGKDACKECHTERFEEFVKSGHGWKLNKVVDGKPPIYPFTELPELPEGVTWDDVTYVIGGYNWKARFVGKDGFIITGEKDDAEYLNQYNFANPIVGNEAGWAKYHSGEERPYNCGTCHTTGYSPEGHQDDLPGLIGTWEEPGITCERCHGPASLHVSDPRGFSLTLDRDSELCGECHLRGSSEAVNAKGGFIQHHEQYEELFQSKHIALDCTVCHDPHLGVVQLRKAELPTTRTQCENCHYEQEKYQNSQVHTAMDVACVDCHMPRVTKSAVGDAAKFTGDIRTHLMGIDFEQIGQFSEDGSTALSQLGLDFACRSCHSDAGMASTKTDDELKQRALNYHARPSEM